MKNYKVTVTRIGYGSLDLEVKAKTEEQAQQKAVDLAANHRFSEHHSDYEIEHIQLDMGKYVVRCSKDDKGTCGFGHKYKKGEYVSRNGKPTTKIDEAYIYECGVDDCPLEEDQRHFEFIPISIKVR